MNNDCNEYESTKTNTRKKSTSGKRSKTSDADDLPSIFTDIFNSINYKVTFFIFVLGILVFSDVFIELFLAPINGAVYADVPTNKGTIIQLMVLTLGYVCVDLLTKGQII